MGRSPGGANEGLNKGAWTETEDRILKDYIRDHGEGKWSSIAKKAGLNRCGKSCRLRWLNYLRPDIKRGNISQDEEELIIRLHKLLGNRWSLIAGRLPGRTDNEIKNYWNTIVGKKLQGRHPVTGTSTSRRASSTGLGSPDRQAKSTNNADAHPGITAIETTPEQDKEGIPDTKPDVTAAGLESMFGRECAPEDFEKLDDHFLSKFLGLDDDNGNIEIQAGDDGMVSRASSSRNSDEAVMSPELMLCESDFQSIASFLEDAELELQIQ